MKIKIKNYKQQENCYYHNHQFIEILMFLVFTWFWNEIGSLEKNKNKNNPEDSSLLALEPNSLLILVFQNFHLLCCFEVVSGFQ